MKVKEKTANFEFSINGYTVHANWIKRNDKTATWDIHIFSFWGEAFWNNEKPTRTRSLIMIEKSLKDLKLPNQ